ARGRMDDARGGARAPPLADDEAAVPVGLRREPARPPARREPARPRGVARPHDLQSGDVLDRLVHVLRPPRRPPGRRPCRRGGDPMTPSRRDQLATHVVLVYWLLLVGGLVVYAALRADDYATIVPLWVGAVGGTMLGQALALHDFRLGVTAIV